MKMVFVLPMLLCFALSSWAQIPSATPPGPVLPPGLLVRSAPEFSQWEITFSYPDEQKKHKAARKIKPAMPVSARLRKVVTTKTGRVIHEQTTDASNRTVDTWYDGAAQYTNSSETSAWCEARQQTGRGPTNSAYHPLPTTGYRDMELVTQENYAGMASYGNRKCLIFTPGGYQKLDLSKADEAQKKLKTMEIVVYIDIDSRLPVAVQTSENLRVFQFGPPPTQMQTLPVELVQQIKNGEAAQARLAEPAARPN